MALVCLRVDCVPWLLACCFSIAATMSTLPPGGALLALLLLAKVC